MKKKFIEELYDDHIKCPDCPGPQRVAAFFNDLLGTLFPDFSKKVFQSVEELELHLNELQLELGHLLMHNPQKDLAWQEAAQNFFQELPTVHDKLKNDVQALFEGDPAAQTPNEVIRSYPGFYAVADYRVAHELLKQGVQVIPRIITEHAHSKTGIDIHPRAVIGRKFCIDHGTGVVIGETTTIGNNVKIYQGVTLGALSVRKNDASMKRHPTIEDNVTIYANATILGGKTTIGHDSIIGGNVWITRSVPPHTKMYYQARMHDSGTGETDLVVYKTSI